MRRIYEIAVAVGLVLLAIFTLSGHETVHAQINPNAPGIQLTTVYSLVPIAATNAVNTQTTLTIPAPPPNYYNYVCTMHFNASQQTSTPSAITNAVSTSTNFNNWALKFSLSSGADANYDWWEFWYIANVGCAKSVSPGTATTFVSPTAASTAAFTWSATYYQAP